MKLFGIINNAIGGVTDLVSEFVQDPDKAKELNHRLKMQLMNDLTKEMEAKRDIIVAEAEGNSFLQRSWRPITMLSFLVLLFVYWFGFAPEYVIENPTVVDSVFDLLKIGIGGYIVGRSAEKVSKNYNKKR